jgi:hypothetical protein
MLTVKQLYIYNNMSTCHIDWINYWCGSWYLDLLTSVSQVNNAINIVRSSLRFELIDYHYHWTIKVIYACPRHKTCNYIWRLLEYYSWLEIKHINYLNRQIRQPSTRITMFGGEWSYFGRVKTKFNKSFC